jgi:hypothetical protein
VREVSEPTIVCILGMHRSGTSLVSRMLNVLGLELGPQEHLMRPSSANPSGHWENLPIAELNEEILLRLGGSWAKPPELVPGWEDKPELDDLRQQARELIEADFSGHDLWGFKDPRASLTAPFWQRVLPPMRYIVCLRNPLDVAASLHAREEEPVPLQQGMDLWLTYVRSALAVTAGHSRQLVFYEDVMADPKRAVRKLARFIERRKSKATKAERRLAIRVAMSEGLWHHRTAIPNVVDAASLPFHVKALYLALRLSVPGAESVGTEVLGPLGAHAGDAGRHLADLERLLSERRADLERLQSARRADLDRLRAEHRADIERLAISRAEEERLRRGLEAELEATRAELKATREEFERVRNPRNPADSTAGEPPAAAVDPLVAEVQARARELIPSGATVLVAGKGDDALLRLGDSRGFHFPSDDDGRYAGYHPAGDTAAIAHLEALRARGADHLLLPKTTLWWLDHYHGFRRHLEDRYVALLEDEQCAIYRLQATDRERETGPIATLKRTVACLRIRCGRDPSILDWHTGLGIAHHLPEMLVFAPPNDETRLPYLDGTIDVVILASANAARIAEARRVAAGAVIRVEATSPERAGVGWLADGLDGWGEDVCLTLIPDPDAAPWEATVGAVAETLDEGFAGELSMIGDSATLGPVGARAAAAGVRTRTLEVSAGASLAERARTAAAAADHRVHIFVTTPAMLLPGWLPSVLALFSDDRDAGIVGARILTSSGALAEAGGRLGADGSRRRRGEGDHDPDRPEYRYVRRVDFCSPPLMAVRREVFERLGGFDGQCLVPADASVDFSLRAAQAGVPVYYQPEARVVAIGNGRR